MDRTSRWLSHRLAGRVRSQLSINAPCRSRDCHRLSRHELLHVRHRSVRRFFPVDFLRTLYLDLVRISAVENI